MHFLSTCSQTMLESVFFGGGVNHEAMCNNCAREAIIDMMLFLCLKIELLKKKFQSRTWGFVTFSLSYFLLAINVHQVFIYKQVMNFLVTGPCRTQTRWNKTYINTAG